MEPTKEHEEALARLAERGVFSLGDPRGQYTDPPILDASGLASCAEANYAARSVTLTGALARGAATAHTCVIIG